MSERDRVTKGHKDKGTKCAWPRVLFLTCAFALAASGAAGQTVDGYREQAQKVNRQIEKKKDQAATFSKKEKACIAQLQQVDRDLDMARKRCEALGNDLDALSTAVDETRNWIADLERRIDQTETYAARRMAALYKLQCLGRMSFLAAAGSVTDFFRRKTALRNILSHDEAVLARLGREKTELAGALTDLEARKAEKTAAEARYRRQLEDLNRKKAQRNALLTEVRGQKRLTLAAIDSLQQSARDLEGKIKSLQLQALEVKSVDEPADGAPGAFPALKGLLKMPVEGKIISKFGRYKNTEFNVVNFQSGIDIEARKGTPIRSVREGRVLFSNWFKGYGNLLIVDHGDSYYTLYAHANEVYKREGDPVRADEVIATVGDTGSLKGPMLHFEIRHHGKPVDPMKWLKKG